MGETFGMCGAVTKRNGKNVYCIMAKGHLDSVAHFGRYHEYFPDGKSVMIEYSWTRE